MATQIQEGDEVVEQIYADLPCYAAGDAEFRALVQAGIASLGAAPTHDLAAIEAELREIIHGHE